MCVHYVKHHMSNTCEYMGVNGKALQLPAVYIKLLQVMQESVSVLQVTQESVSVVQVE